MPFQQNLTTTILKNASANLVRLVGAGVIALLLPAFLVRHLATSTYSLWALLLQWSLYIGFLDFGIQIAVSRFVAHEDERDDAAQRDGIVSTAFLVMSAGTVLGIGFTCVLAWQFPHIFSSMPASLHHQSQIALLLMAGSVALGLPVNVIQAVFIGLQRNVVPVGIALITKILMAVLIVGVVLRQDGLAVMGGVVALANLLSYSMSYLAWRKWAPQIRIHLRLASKICARRIVSYSSALAVWIAASFIISGLDLSVVGIFDYHATAYYAVAATLTNFVAQAQNAMFAALLPASAVLAARGDSEQLGVMLLSSTRYSVLLLLVMALPLIVGGHLVLRIWVGADYALHGVLLLQILLVANFVRLCALPYSTLLLGTGQQGKVIASPVAEAVTNLAASVAGAYFLGAVGVALGTLAGAFVGVGLHLFYNMPRTAHISIDQSLLIRQSLLRPLACAAPLASVFALRAALPGLSDTDVLLFGVVAAAATAWLLWNYGLVTSERQRLSHVLRLRLLPS
jgi:O-antigen/teichoic acid export membrane protein